MTKKIASNSFAILTAALMLFGASACSTVSTQPEEQSAEVPAAAPAMDESVSNTTSSAADTAVVDTQTQSAPVINEPAANSAPSSLGASSSGRGH